MNIKDFVKKYAFIGGDDNELTVDAIVNMVEDCLVITAGNFECNNTEKVVYGNFIIQGMFYSALFDQNNGNESKFDKFIIDHCVEICNKFAEKCSTKDQNIELLQ